METSENKTVLFSMSTAGYTTEEEDCINLLRSQRWKK